ncbi:hypothetical protein CLV28_0606 [Sediminihabitans luteus]|uniref:Uncharacterized protein n=1 Tax=Sediminihabitans luteus TaxID=1138585 RepID=A0A2M9CZR4_9CELL|nr:hypothetical protein [Sediminihabitans luteus]PJJ77387.1 hypothetical protein CLV28_0606 [Sediminihabitans luteus]GII98280.1 hypothetical protein Slu03_06580 [Sediminihabitans luteus]
MSTTSSARPGRGTYVARRIGVLVVLLLVLGGIVAGVVVAVGLASPAPATVMSAAVKSAPPTPLPPGSPERCGPDDLSLELSTSEGTYVAPDKPLFSVTITGQGRHACIVDGADATRAVTVATADGEHVWSSADCGTGQRLLLVAHGDVDARTLQWDRTTSTPGCKGKPAAAPAGDYVATLTVAGVDGLTSDAVRFTLSDPAPEPTATPEPSATAGETAKATETATPTDGSTEKDATEKGATEKDAGTAKD